MATKTKNAGKGLSPKDQRNMAPRGLAGKKNGASNQSEGQSKQKIFAPEGTDPTYLLLIARLPLRPIRSDAELDKAVGVIDELTDRDDLSPAESDYLDVLGDLVEKYEDEHIVMPYISDAAMLRTLMEEKEATQADVVRGTRISKTVLSLVLNGKRDLTREHIGALSKYFGVGPAVFLGPD